MKRLLIAAALGFASLAAHAADLGISAQDTYAKIQNDEKNVLFIDVRDPVEIMFVGFSDAVHANVPFMLVDRTQWNAEKGVFRLYRNPDFINQVKLQLAKRGLSADAEIITMCRWAASAASPVPPSCARTASRTPAMWSMASRVARSRKARKPASACRTAGRTAACRGRRR